MRIFFIATKPNPDTMDKHIIETLLSMGHNVGHFNIKSGFNFGHKVNQVTQFVLRNVMREPERINENKLLRHLSDFQPDLVLVLLGSIISPKTIKKIRKIYSGKVVCWCQDQMTTLGRQYLIGSDYDKVFVKDHYLVDVFRNYLGMDVHYLPEACNPNHHKYYELNESEKQQYKSDICTFGNIYYYRQAILETLSKYDLQVWGHRPGWLIDHLGDKFMGRPIYEAEKCKAISGAKITLNTLHFGEVNGLNCRAFEVGGCGGFQLISYSPVIEEHFKIGKEIEVFKDKAELLDKVEYYLKNQEEARNIAIAGYQRSHNEHTYEHRLRELLSIVQ